MNHHSLTCMIRALLPIGPYVVRPWLLVGVLLLAGCGGNEQAGTAPGADRLVLPSPGERLPSDGSARRVAVTLNADQTMIDPGASVTLEWRSANSSSCTASGGWNGPRKLSGSEVLTDVQVAAEYWLSCTDVAGEGAVAGVAIQLRPKDTLWIDFKAEPRVVEPGERAVLSWRAHNAEACTARGDWNGKQALEGKLDTGSLLRSAQFTLECSNQYVTEMATATVRVGTVVIEWQAPALKVDGSAADDVVGYRVHWGQAPDQVDGSVSIDDPRQTSWEADLPPGIYYFSVSALDQEGNESERSTPVRKQLF